MSAPILSIKDLHVVYCHQSILADISFDLFPGQNLGLLGPNGCGKTTLLRCIGGLLEPASGHIYLHGRQLASYSPKMRAQLLASVPCQSATMPYATLLEYVLLGRFPWLSWLCLYSRKDREYALAALAAVGLEDLAQCPVAALSAGQARLGTLARALTQLRQVPQPLLLLDEMSANLDLKHRIGVSDLLATMQRRNNCAMLQAMHDCNLAALYCTHLLGIKNGRMLFCGPVDKVFTMENLSELYEWPVGIHQHPDLPRPQIYAHISNGTSILAAACQGRENLRR